MMKMLRKFLKKRKFKINFLNKCLLPLEMNFLVQLPLVLKILALEVGERNHKALRSKAK